MSFYATCPCCAFEFEPEPYEPGTCPGCGGGFYWDDVVAEDYSDSWAELYWDSYEPRPRKFGLHMLNSVGYLFANGPFPAINDWFMSRAQENWPLYREGHLPDHFVVCLPFSPEKHGLLCLRQPFRAPAFDTFEPIPQEAWDRIIADHGAIGPDSIPKGYQLTMVRLPQELLPFTPQQLVDAAREMGIVEV